MKLKDGSKVRRKKRGELNRKHLERQKRLPKVKRRKIKERWMRN